MTQTSWCCLEACLLLLSYVTGNGIVCFQNADDSLAGLCQYAGLDWIFAPLLGSSNNLTLLQMLLAVKMMLSRTVWRASQGPSAKPSARKACWQSMRSWMTLARRCSRRPTQHHSDLPWMSATRSMKMWPVGMKSSRWFRRVTDLTDSLWARLTKPTSGRYTLSPLPPPLLHTVHLQTVYPPPRTPRPPSNP